jgi:hypothetical protein
MSQRRILVGILISICLLIYNNCGLKTKDPLGNYGTVVTNPVTELAVAPFSSQSLDSANGFKACISRLILKSNSAPDTKLNFHVLQEKVIPSAGTSLEALPIPEGKYSQISLEVTDACGIGKSLNVINAQGNFKTAQSVALAFSGEVTVDSNTKKINFYIQPIVNSLDTTASDVELPIKATVHTGEISAPDTWFATTVVGAPGQRASFASAWTGSEMIVWGGYQTGVFYTDGGRVQSDDEQLDAHCNCGYAITSICNRCCLDGKQNASLGRWRLNGFSE